MSDLFRKISTKLALKLVGVLTLALFGATAPAQTQSPAGSTATKDSVVTTHAIGTFEVKVLPYTEDKYDEGTTLSRYTLDKQYHGDLEAISNGEMLTAGSDVKGSGAYVAMERVDGTLNGRKGSFVLVHKGTMGHGSTQLSVTVVPDSGTGQLAGISGTLNIAIADGKHSYDLEYAIPEAR